MEGVGSLPTPADYRLPFVGATPETPTTTTFRFGIQGTGFQYLPNQFVFLGLPGVADPNRGPYRPFSLSSSPTEGEAIAITARLTESPFKERLVTLEEGEEVLVRGPLGDFILDPRRNALMLAGGIGISPFRGMIRYAADMQLSTKIVLLYAVRTPGEIVFRKELDRLAESWDNFRVVTTITRPRASHASWKGRTGRFDPPAIREYAAPLERPLYYLCGTPHFVRGMGQLLLDEVQIRGEDIRVERFRGYRS